MEALEGEEAGGGGAEDEEAVEEPVHLPDAQPPALHLLVAPLLPFKPTTLYCSKPKFFLGN